MADKSILLNAKEIEEKYHIPYASVLNANRRGDIKGNRIGRGILFDEEKVIKPWLGLAPSDDELVKLKLENEKLKSQVNMYRSQFSTVKQLMETVNGVINVI